jgi:CheY-like chemotaxis protein
MKNSKPILALFVISGLFVLSSCHCTEQKCRYAFGIVLIDVQLPFMDGLEATRIIRTEFPEPKNNIIIAMTAGALKSEAGRCLNAGMNDYIAKPFNPALLIEKLSHYNNRL